MAHGLINMVIDADRMAELFSTSPFDFPGGARTHMLDAFKTMTGGKNKLVQKQTDELELLITTAREERSAISAMLTALTTRSAKLAPLGKTLEQVSEKTAGVTSRLDEIAKRLTALDDRTRELAELDKRIQALRTPRQQAEQTTQKALGPGRRAAEASRGRPASVVAGARHPGDARHAEEGARRARRAPRPAAEVGDRGQAVARPVELAQGGARTDSRRRRHASPRTTPRSARPRARRAKTPPRR